jgi:hypothetical protein
MLWDGALLEGRLRASSVSDDEISAAVRKAGLRSLADAQVVLDNVGEWSVVAQSVGPRRLPCARASPALLRQRAPSTFRRCVAI